MPACQGRPCTPDRQICHCTGWPSQWHSDGLWDRRPGCRGAWIGCRYSSHSISSLLLCLHVSSSSHLWSACEGSDISSPACVHKLLRDPPKPLFCDVGASQTSLFWCPLNVKMSKVTADENKRQTSFAPDRCKTFPTDQIKSQARDQIGKGDTVSVVKFTHPWETQESKLTSNVALWHTADRSFLNTEKMFFFFG